jgi:hypothetical protein
VKRLTGVEPQILPAAERAIADPPGEPPALLVERAQAAGFVLDEHSWSKLDADARYALMKMGAGKVVSQSLTAALQEFLGAQSEAAPVPETKS